MQTVKEKVDKSWAHSEEYRRLRRRNDGMEKTLESEGIEVESNPTFTTEDGEANDDSCEVAPVETGALASATPAGDPFRGEVSDGRAQPELTYTDCLSRLRQHGS
ncbi:MAG TPA: hypothetical protein VF944_05620 [Candidatus Bathyarchaeia archaeon]